MRFLPLRCAVACRLENMEYYAERRLKRLGLLDDNGSSTWDGGFVPHRLPRVSRATCCNATVRYGTEHASL